MKNLKAWLTLLIAGGLAVTVQAQTAPLKGTTIHICEDGAEWPPYTYYERMNGEPTKKIIGFAVDVVEEMFRKNGINYTVELLPWARCQALIKDGNEYQMALNASYSEQRNQTYLLPRVYYRTYKHYFYSKKNNPKGLAVSQMADLKKFRVCGLLGYSYAAWGFDKGTIDQGSTDFPALLRKLQEDRCHLFLEQYEIMVGFNAIGKRYLDDPDLGTAPIPGAESTPFHMMISRSYPQANALLALVNQELEDLEKTGKLQKLLKKYIP